MPKLNFEIKRKSSSRRGAKRAWHGKVCLPPPPHAPHVCDLRHSPWSQTMLCTRGVWLTFMQMTLSRRRRRLPIQWQYLYRNKPFRVPLPISNICMRVYWVTASIDPVFRLKLSPIRFISSHSFPRTSFPLSYVNRQHTPPYMVCVLNLSWESQLVRRASDINANWKHEMRYIAA